MDENKSGLYIVAIVGVIAVVALVILVLGAGSGSNTGQAYRVASEDAAGQVTTGPCACRGTTQSSCESSSCCLWTPSHGAGSSGYCQSWYEATR